ncbi:hypothetical protein [Erythrobacter sp.]|jgi:hypothetical protein|uniref:hypothetical protein n=1 Tax=Erythrobacter sp. TaxID=1042 RepID=UPI002EC5FEF3|nr:hypothetical protein [Erythrobacter sp.]
MRENAKVRLARRQLLLAQSGRREAMAALADALGEERRSDDLAQRARELCQAYGVRSGSGADMPFAYTQRFVQALGQVACDADRSHREARTRSQHRTTQLAAANERTRIIEDRHAAACREARAEADAARERECLPPVLARRLQSKTSKSVADRLPDGAHKTEDDPTS